MPAKGMTLPFISGGSSMISVAYAMGMLLALTREQPHAGGDMAGCRRWPGAGADLMDASVCAALVLLAAGGFPAAISFQRRRWRTRLHATRDVTVPTSPPTIVSGALQISLRARCMPFRAHDRCEAAIRYR